MRPESMPHPAGGAGGGDAPAAAPSGPLARLKRAGLLVAMTAATMNIFTGSPLLALWVGSRVQGASQQPTMAPIFVVAVCLLIFSLALFRLLGRLGNSYDKSVGREPSIREHKPWLRSLRGERPHEEGDAYRLTALDIILCVGVMLAVGVFEYWFFFESTSSIDQRSGR